jgi:glutamate/tyrosine decarboxylase-like PLP-dependent enzyme
MTRVNHPRFHAYIPAPGSFYSTLGDLLASATNPFVGSWLGGATFVALELDVLDWISQAIHYAPAHGIFTSGGSMANLGAIATARARHGHDTLRNGTLYFSSQGHASFDKAARVLGYRDEQLRTVEAQLPGVMDLSDLANQIAADRDRGLKPFLICANAGTTNTGAIDPLPEIAELCRRERLWFHVDGAYGGFAALCPTGRQLLAGMEQADSLTLDPHKWLYAPMGVGCLLTHDLEAMESAFETGGDYLRDLPPGEVNFFARGPELSRPARVLPVWALIRTVGMDALAAQVEADLALASYVEHRIESSEHFEVAATATLSIVCFRQSLRPGESEQERARRDDLLVQKALVDGRVMLSSTLLGKRNALRLVVMNHRTDAAELDTSLAVLEELSLSL